MADNKQVPAEAAQPDYSEPSQERQSELRASHEANVTVGKPPYSDVGIHTMGELQWVLKERGWSTDPLSSQERIDFRGVDLSSANLKGASLYGSRLSGAFLLQVDLSEANLSDADLSDADLSGAKLNDANLEGANLSRADLREASLRRSQASNANFTLTNMSTGDVSYSDLSQADLTGSLFGPNVKGASLAGANLSKVIFGSQLVDVDLRAARMDGATMLGSLSFPIGLSGNTRLLDVAWNGANPTALRWDVVPRLGDEADIKAAASRAERVTALRNAARAYRGLSKALQAQGLTIPALRYRRREQQLERHALLSSFALGPWVFSCLLNIVAGYGDRPGRALACYLAVVGAFTGAYWAITNQVFGFIQSHSAHLAWYEALVLSISSFHGRGFFPSMLSLGDPIALVAAAEAIIGLFIELVFLATFTQRFFAR